LRQVFSQVTPRAIINRRGRGALLFLSNGPELINLMRSPGRESDCRRLSWEPANALLAEGCGLTHILLVNDPDGVGPAGIGDLE